MIEVTKQMLEEKTRQARGDAAFAEDKICEALLAEAPAAFRKYPGILQTYVGLYATAKRRAEQMKEG